MDEGARGWICRTAIKNFWRVHPWYELDDLIQDGYCLYYKMRKRYPDVVNRPHIMRLLQVSYINHIHDIARRRRRDVVEDTESQLNQDQISAIKNLPCDCAALLQLIAEAPGAVKTVLVKAMTTKALRSKFRRRLNGGRETWNDRFCRMAGLDPKTNKLHQDVITYLRT